MEMPSAAHRGRDGRERAPCFRHHDRDSRSPTPASSMGKSEVQEAQLSRRAVEASGLTSSL